ncbi:hypothetical protein [Wolbachia pipientis]|uniref:hypothetical protein n=1 Tax=Wolbachia pipientis TaxID=955 RepID=UPI0025A3AE27|nr:hypothetical protein [Wolbachia pipientis]MDM8335052.1 hypothetical protein [Wolbachia pipientis]
MLNNLKKKPNTFAQRVHDTHNHDIRKIICITTGLIALLCKISLQFCCEFIDNNRFNIYLIQNVAQLIKFPTSILYIAHLAFTLHDLIKDYRGSNGKKELAKIVSKSANLASSTIEALIMLKVIHFLTRENANLISYIHLTSTILFLFISEHISYYYTYKKYQDAHKKYQDKKGTNEFTECKKELAKCKKALIISTLALLLSLLNFILKRVDIATIPINLSNGVIYNFNLSETVGIIYNAVFLAFQLDKLFHQPINNDPSTDLYGVDHNHHERSNHDLPNGCRV